MKATNGKDCGPSKAGNMPKREQDKDLTKKNDKTPDARFCDPYEDALNGPLGGG